MELNNKLIEKIQSLDFTMLKRKLQDPEVKGWSQSKVDKVEEEYRKFIYLMATEGIEQVPVKEVDDFWHQHILDTCAYAEDCNKIFGYFVHHFPYLGMRGEKDKQELIRKFNLTKIKYKKNFGLAECSGGSGRCSSTGCIGSCSSHEHVSVSNTY